MGLNFPSPNAVIAGCCVCYDQQCKLQVGAEATSFVPNKKGKWKEEEEDSCQVFEP